MVSTGGVLEKGFDHLDRKGGGGRVMDSYCHTGFICRDANASVHVIERFQGDR